MAGAGRRAESIEVLRGLAVARMIVVNNPGDWTVVFTQLHAYWTGLTLEDFVFSGVRRSPRLAGAAA